MRLLTKAFTRAFFIWLIPALYLMTYQCFKYGLDITPVYLVPSR